MRWALAFVSAAAAFMMTVRTKRNALAERVGTYLRPPRPRRVRGERVTPLKLQRAGLPWSPRQLRIRRVWASAGGAAVGALAAQGDLFLEGTGRSLPALLLLGSLSGLLIFSVWLTTRQERRAIRLVQELPTVADAIALFILAGEPVAGALASFVQSAGGVAADELGRTMTRYRQGVALPEALAVLSRETAHPDAGRLYSLLGNAHEAGGHLAGSLGSLAADYRASLEHSMRAEGGRRALATYGPILALMIPVSLVFLMYPTLLGLRQLSGSP